MNLTQLQQAIKHFDKSMSPISGFKKSPEGAGYFVRVFLISGVEIFGAVALPESGRSDTLGIESPNEENAEGEAMTTFVDISSIAAIKGPFMGWPSK